jgi:hypothetical protein
MIQIALAQTHTFWGIALGIGAVVLLVVILLMALLLGLLKDVDVAVKEASTMARGVAANTVAIEQLPTTAAVLADIREEAQVHYELLSKQ